MSDLMKKNSTWSISEISKFKIESIKKEVSGLSTEWLIDTTRQETYETHKNTQAIQMISSDYNWQPGTDLLIENKQSFKDNDANIEIDGIYKYLKDIYSGNIIRSEIINLRANTDIRKHVDGGPVLHYARRCHIPIITNPDVYFTVNNNTINMLEGVCYEINNSMPHSVSNKSSFDRVHIIIDIMPDNMLNYVKIGDLK
jgi:hypothetical protein